MDIKLVVAAALAAMTMTAWAAAAHAAAGAEPIRLAMSMHIGWDADRTRGRGVCVVASKDTCLSRKPSRQAGGFEYPSSVATDPQTGELYVTDTDNYRVQKFAVTGAFIAMFGWNVDETKDTQARTTQAERNVCTAVSGDRCGAGVPGTAAGQLSYPASVAVDPLTGDVYVLEIGNDVRVDKYSPGGRFLWTIGKEVNGATKGNFCSEGEIVGSGVKCGAGVRNAPYSLQPGAFKSDAQYGDLLATGGPEDLLYVGDEHRVQEFDAKGGWRGEILLASISSEPASGVAALAVDPGGDLYVVYWAPSGEDGAQATPAGLVRKFNPHGEQVGLFPVYPRQAGAVVHIDGIALDEANVLAVIGVEIGATSHKRFGSLYDAGTGRPIGEFPPPPDTDGRTVNNRGDLYVAATDDHEVVAYAPIPATELVTSPAPCEIGAAGDSAAAFDCALSG
jgi:hypothetical protein